jgi:hypothetical protein
MPYALCFLPTDLCLLTSVVFPRLAFFPMPHALCPMPSTIYNLKSTISYECHPLYTFKVLFIIRNLIDTFGKPRNNQ